MHDTPGACVAQADEQAKKLAKEAADAERREAEKAARAAAAAQYRDAEWIAEAEADGDSGSDGEEAAELVAFACELCDKRFKSEAAFANHERCAASRLNTLASGHPGLACLARDLTQPAKIRFRLLQGCGCTLSTTKLRPKFSVLSNLAGACGMSWPSVACIVSCHILSRRSRKHVEAVAAMRAVLEEEEGLNADVANNSAAAASDDEVGNSGRVASDKASPGSQVDSGADEAPAAQEQRLPAQQQQPQDGERRGKKKKKKKRNQRHGDVNEGSDSDAGSRQQAGMHLDPLAAELEALGLAGSAAELGAAAAHSDSHAAESQESELDDEATLERLVGSRTRAAEGSGNCDAAPSQHVAPVDVDASDAEAAGSDGEGAGSAAEGTPTDRQGVKSRRAKVKGSAANGQSPAVPAPAGGSAALAAEQDGKPTTKRQKRKQKQKGTQTAQAAGVPLMACGVCGLEFESRTQLFKHIASSGHALLKA